ncbi:MAG: hypothetical protein K8R69_12075, partial [Deltaproteobacteria bacterium]|nr:hypothetical protein [Deltaproteobacteria bacterium]
VLFAGALSAQEAQQPGFSDFWKNFQSAVVKDDRESVANMTVLPFYWGASLDRGGFLKAYPKVFDAKVRECFRQGKPIKDGPFQNLFCGRLMYRFGADSGIWHLLEVADND